MFLKNFFKLFTGTRSLSLALKELDFQIEDLQTTTHCADQEAHDEEIRLRNLEQLLELKKKKMNLLYLYLEEVSDRSAETTEKEQTITLELEGFSKTICELERKVSNKVLIDSCAQEKIQQLNEILISKKEMIQACQKDYASKKENLLTLETTIDEMNLEILNLEEVYQALAQDLERITNLLLEEGYIRDSLGNMIKDKKVESEKLEEKFKILLAQKDKIEKFEKEQKSIQNDLKCENIRLKQDLENITSRIHQCESKTLDLKKENSILESINASVAQNIKTLNEEVLIKSSALEDERFRRSSNEMNKEIISSKLLESQLQLDQIELNLKEILKENEKLDLKINENELLKSRVADEISTASDLLTKAKMDNEFRIEKKKAIASLVEEKQVELSYILKEVKDNKMYSGELENTIQELNVKLRRAEAESTSVSEKLHMSSLLLKELEEERQRLLATRGRIQRNNEELEEQILLNNSKIYEEEEILQKTKSNIEEIEKTLGKLRGVLKTLNEKRDNLANIQQKEIELFNERSMLKDSLTQESQSVEAQILNKINEIESHRYKLEILRDDISKSEISLEQKVKKKEDLVQEETLISSELKDLLDRNNGVEKRIVEIEEEIVLQNSKKNILNTDFSKAQVKKKEKEVQLHQLETILTQNSEVFKDLKNELNLLVEENKGIDVQIDQKRQESSVLKEKLVELESQISSLEVKVSSRRDELEELTEELSKVKELSSTIEQEVLIKTDVYEQYTCQTSKINKEVSNYKSRISTYSEEIREYDQKIIELAKSQNELSLTRQNLEIESNSYANIVADLKRTASKVILENSENQSFIKKLSQNLEAINLKKSELQALIVRYEDENLNLATRQAALERELKYTQEEINELSGYNQVLYEKNSSQIESSTLKEMNLISMRQKLIELNTSKTELEEKAQEVNKSLASKAELLSSCSLEISQVVAQTSRLNNEILAKKKQIELKEDEILKLEIEANKYADALQEKDSTLSSIKTKLALKSKDFSSLSRKRDTALEKLNQVKSELLLSEKNVESYKIKIQEIKNETTRINLDLEKYNSSFEEVELVRYELESKYLLVDRSFSEQVLKLKELKAREDELLSIKENYSQLIEERRRDVEEVLLSVSKLTNRNEQLEASNREDSSKYEKLNSRISLMRKELESLSCQAGEKEKHSKAIHKDFIKAEERVRALQLEYEKLHNMDRKLFVEISNYSSATKNLISKASELEEINTQKRDAVSRKQNILSQAKVFASPPNIALEGPSLKELLSCLEKKVSLNFFDASYNVEIEEISDFFKDGVNVLNDYLYLLLNVFSNIKKINVRSSKNLGQIKVTGSFKTEESLDELRAMLFKNEFGLGFSIVTTEAGLCIDFKQASFSASTLRTN